MAVSGSAGLVAGIESSGAAAHMRGIADEGNSATLSNMRAFARSLKRHGALRSGVSVTQAGDILYSLGSSHTHELLRRRCGWSVGRHRRWITNSLVAALL